jgi:hypothetical protein
MSSSSRTSASLAVIDRFLPRLAALPAGGHRDRLVEEAEALRRAIAAFHMEAIRFRMHAVDRLLRTSSGDPSLAQLFDELRHELEAAGFHTRSHTAP